MNKEERTKTLINNIKLNINEQNVHEFGLCIEQWKQILDYIGELQQENKRLKEIENKLNFIKNRVKQGMSQENINKCAIELVNSYLKEVE